MKNYTIYDNADGGYTIWWTHYDKYNGRWLKKKMQVNTKESMVMWKRRLEADGYKFVGKL
jgi:hypothetical protein